MDLAVLLVCQFPICDARPFVGGAGARLRVPGWPTPLTPSFVRAFGRVGRRLRGGHAVFKDEAFYASAHHAFRFDRLETRRLTSSIADVRAKCAFRRLHCDGLATVRVEVGLATPRPGAPVTSQQVLSLVAGVLGLPVIARGPAGGQTPTRLEALGAHLARLYASASTPRKPAPPVADPKLVAAGEPLILVEYDADELPFMPKGAREIEAASPDGVRLSFLWHVHGGREIGLWFLRGPSIDPQVRRLRLGLMRVHAEHQVLKRVLSLRRTGAIEYVRQSEGSRLFDTYIQRVTPILDAERGSDQIDMAIRDVLGAYDALANPDERALLADALRDVRRQIRENFLDYVDRAIPDPSTASTATDARPIRVFVSYSHQDKKYLGSILRYLTGMPRTDGVSFWHDERILAGDIWDEVIRNEMVAADIALVLVSQDFLNSTYCQDVEMQTFIAARRESGLLIFPVILSDCDWQSYAWLKATQFLPPEGTTLTAFYGQKSKRDALYLKVLRQLREHVRRIRAGLSAGTVPPSGSAAIL